jgi:hypothetical protein
LKHPSCRELFEYWNQLRGRDDAPLRQQVEPAKLRRILADTFILETTGDGAFRYRLAGTRLCMGFCRELKASDFVAGFGAPDRARLLPVLRTTTEEAKPATFTMTTWNGRGVRLAYEGILLPLRNAGTRCDRILGAMAPAEQPFWFGTAPLVGQELGALKILSERRSGAKQPELRPFIPARPQRPSLVVIEGGKA